MKHTTLLLAAATTVAASQAQANIVINELLGSTSGSDWEFIELFNAGVSPVDISGYTVTLYDADDGGTDGGSPYVVPDATTLGAGEFFLFANPLATTGFSVVPDVTLPANAVENSPYTVLLEDSAGGNVYSVLVTDGTDALGANEAGTPIVADLTAGPDGTFLPAGFFLEVDGGSTAGFLEFGTGNLTGGAGAGGSPGFSNVIPEPTSIAVLGMAGLAALRRRRV
ncbi:MAG: lamin tail domain-containing protein [Planctomycetota bacterium]